MAHSVRGAANPTPKMWLLGKAWKFLRQNFYACLVIVLSIDQSITFNEHVTNVHAWSLEMTLR